MSESKDFLDVLAAVGPIVIGISVVFIYLQQLKIAKLAYEEKLFERRLRAFELVETLHDKYFGEDADRRMARHNLFNEVSSFDLVFPASVVKKSRETADIARQIDIKLTAKEKAEYRNNEAERSRLIDELVKLNADFDQSCLELKSELKKFMYLYNNSPHGEFPLPQKLGHLLGTRPYGR